MSKNASTIESLQLDPHYRWNDHITDRMAPEEIWIYLIREADELDGVREFECSYGIYRELVWRYPDRAKSWEGLARFATKMGFDAEAQIAQAKSVQLRSVSENGSIHGSE
jgi:hypothetical protein